MIPTKRPNLTRNFLLCVALLGACAQANFPSGGPALSGSMQADPCRAMDRALRAASLPIAKETTQGPCRSDTLPAKLDELALIAQPAALAGSPVTAELYYSSSTPLSVYVGPRDWIGYANAEQRQSATLPAGEKQRAFVLLPAWSTDPQESKTAAAKIRPGSPGGTLAGLVVHAWRIYPYAPPPAAKGMTYVLP